MDSYEATRIVFSRIQNLDPENASKIIGYLLLLDHGDKEMIRLAFGPEALIHSLIFKAKTHLGLPISNPPSPSPPPPFSYAGVVNGCAKSLHGVAANDNGGFVDDFQFQEHVSDYLTGGSGGYADSTLHRRSFSVPGLCLTGEDLKPCLYFARGFCKNGSKCKFIHGDHCAENELEHCQELLRSKSFQQAAATVTASQFMAGGASLPYRSPLMITDELHKYGRCRAEAAMGANSNSRQIYLTFPADSTFKEEDVSNYFSIYGPVQDVRIPYQQKRMFGFVTFVYPETVKLILSKGNPHFVCDSRVLVKPYKEKGKVHEKKQQQLERGEYSATPVDSREPFDLQLGTRMFYNAQEMMLRRKLEEQADLQQAIELQGRRLMNLQLLDLKNQHHSSFHHSLSTGSPIPSPLSTGSPIPSPTVSRIPTNQARIFPVEATLEDNGGLKSPAADKLLEEVKPVCNHKSDNGITVTKEDKANTEQNDFPESLEHILPDNLFASPKKSTGECFTVFTDEKNRSPANTSGLNVASLKSCFLQLPRFSSGQGA
ncbi:hypothetical protein ES319_A13G237600v1 [Gossypium barbadense]|uniref:C3H1-type domain-containing protein n=1 Tax=Gossypium barbadense TaxID=3634 RepID=A0A5J5T382_GOSBA|nr:hypothetical protein ES319_A13G237600v1 [Gossypium barbadense]